jgi:nuclear pore complex protein Nup62
MVTISEGLVSTVSLAFAYHEPYTTSIIPKNGPTAGGYFVEASGLYFGTSDYSPSIQLENRVCEATVWVSDSFALCKVPEIERSVLTSAIITVASQTAEREKNALFAYNAPKITSIYYSNGPTTGGTIITLFGEQFGLENNIVASRIGPSSTNSTDWQSDSVITVLTAAGLGRVQTFLLSIIKIQIEYMNPDAEEPVFLFDKPVYMLYVFMYMYICIFICMYICMYMYMCICARMCICTCICMHVYMYSHTHMHTYTYTHIYIYTYIHVYIHTHTHIVHTHTHVHQ